MSGILIHLDLPDLEVQAGGIEAVLLREAKLNAFLARLADELNSELPEYEVRLVHLDMDDYLEFIPRISSESAE